MYSRVVHFLLGHFLFSYLSRAKIAKIAKTAKIAQTAKITKIAK